MQRTDNKVFGHHGRFLQIDLSRDTSEAHPLSQSVLRRYLGGSGLGTHLLLQTDSPENDALDPTASLAIVLSPLVGSPLTTSAKFAVVSKSPLTGRLNDSLASSRFAIAGKQTGFDAIVITGCAAEPAVIIIDDGSVRIEKATDVWGTDCTTAQALLRERYGADYAIATIGIAGENLVRYATISHDGRHAGRGGSGTVLGSKRIKAILVRGSHRSDWADPIGLNELARNLSERSLGPATAKYRELGTASNLLLFNRLGTLPTRNFQAGTFAEAENLAPETLTATRQKTRGSCAACTIGCEHIYQLDKSDGPAGGVRLEYENLFALGPLCGVGDSEAVLRASQLCDQFGLDTISAGGTIAFAMECVEKGHLDIPWLRFGDGDALHRAIGEIAQRRGPCGRLAEGSRRLALEIGHDTIRFAPQVKGLEIPGYEPRALQTMALGFAVSSRGADHNRSSAYEVDFSDQVDRRNVGPEAARLAVETENRAVLMDSTIICKFLRGTLEDFYAELAQMLCYTTGWDVTAEELQTTAQRIVAARKYFNIRAGWQPNEDTLPDRFLQDQLPGDAQATLSPQRLAALVRAYNTERGWTDEGHIPAARLKELQID